MTTQSTAIRTVQTGILEIAYCESGSPGGWPVVLSHGFPYDVHAYDEVVPILAAADARVIVPYLRGFGPTRFSSNNTLRSGQCISARSSRGVRGDAPHSPPVGSQLAVAFSPIRDE